MVPHKCLKETEITLQSKAMTDMVDKINKIEIKVDKIFDILWSQELAYTKNNLEIREVIQKEFSLLNIKFKEEKEHSIDEIKKRTKDNYASKLVEKTVYAFIWLICITVVWALLTLILWK